MCYVVDWLGKIEDASEVGQRHAKARGTPHLADMGVEVRTQWISTFLIRRSSTRHMLSRIGIGSSMKPDSPPT